MITMVGKSTVITPSHVYTPSSNSCSDTELFTKASPWWIDTIAGFLIISALLLSIVAVSWGLWTFILRPVLEYFKLIKRKEWWQ